MTKKTVVCCALTGVLTDPKAHHVPVTPEQMAGQARQAFDAGATVVHCHFRDQRPGMGHMATWDLDSVGKILKAIKEEVPELIINMTSGVPGNDISGPLACLENFKPGMAACNAGSLNYLKLRSNGEWAWPPMLFDNTVEKVQKYLAVMIPNNIVPEFECFDTGILRSVSLYRQNGMFSGPASISLVMGVSSGMAAKAAWLPLLKAEMPEGIPWQVDPIGRSEIWDVYRTAVELGGNVRTGLEDTFYLPNGEKTDSNGALTEALVRIVKEAGGEVAGPAEAREILGIRNV